MERIVIEVRGGNVVNVASTIDSVEIITIDYDAEQVGGDVEIDTHYNHVSQEEIDEIIINAESK